MDPALTTLISDLLANGGSIQTVATAGVLWLLWQQFKLHREERLEWNRRFDELARENAKALIGNGKALQELRLTMVELIARLKK